jgi:hypothetical protein
LDDVLLDPIEGAKKVLGELAQPRALEPSSQFDALGDGEFYLAGLDAGRHLTEEVFAGDERDSALVAGLIGRVVGVALGRVGAQHDGLEERARRRL